MSEVEGYDSGSSTDSCDNAVVGPAARTRAKSRAAARASESPESPQQRHACRQGKRVVAEKIEDETRDFLAQKVAASSRTATPRKKKGSRNAQKETAEAADGGCGHKVDGGDAQKQQALGKPFKVQYAAGKSSSASEPGSSGAWAGIAAGLLAIAVALLLAGFHGNVVALFGPGGPLDATFVINRPGTGVAGRQCNSRMSPHVLRDYILPSGPSWADWTEHVVFAAANWAKSGRDTRKALTLLLVGESEDACSRAAAILPPSFPACLESGCILQLEGLDFSQTADDQEKQGRLQGALVAFLRRCPQGVVIVNGLHHLGHWSIPVLFSALSENGQFEHMGRTVYSSHAVFIFTLQMDLGDNLLQEPPEVFERHVKQELVNVLLNEPGSGMPCSRVTTRQPQGGADDNAGDKHSSSSECIRREKSLNAFRRRFDTIGAIATNAVL